MTILKIAVGLTLAALAAGGFYTCSPAARTAVQSHGSGIFGWTDAARQADPAGFARYVEQTQQQNLTGLRVSRDAMVGEAASLGSKLREQAQMKSKAEAIADACRQAYQAGVFPVSLYGSTYSEGELKLQVRSLLAEVDAYTNNIEKLAAIQAEVEGKIEEYTARIEELDANLVALGAQRELLQARNLSDSNRELLVQVDRLLDARRQPMAINPVRPTRNILQDIEPTPQQVNDERLNAFLSTQVTADVAETEPTVETAVEPAELQAEQAEIVPAGSQVELHVKPQSRVAIFVQEN